MKKIFKNTLIFIIIFSLAIACSKETNENKEKTDAIKFKEEYEALNNTISEKDGKKIRSITIKEDNPIQYKTADELVEMINNKETFVVYFGFPDCPWCRSVIPTLIEVASKLNFQKIYYVDVKEIRDTLSLNEEGKIVVENEGSEGYKKLLKILDNVLEKYTLTNAKGKKIDTKEKRIYAPNIVAIKDGVSLKLTDGISEKQENGYVDITEEMKREMFDKIEEVLKEIA